MAETARKVVAAGRGMGQSARMDDFDLTNVDANDAAAREALNFAIAFDGMVFYHRVTANRAGKFNQGGNETTVHGRLGVRLGVI